MKLRNIYYIFWVDIILRYLKRNPERTDLKSRVLLVYSTIQAINLITILWWLKYFNVIKLTMLELYIFPIESLNNATSFFIQFVFPFFVLNYFLIFHNNRYKVLIEKYPVYRKKYVIIYSVSVLWISFSSAIIIGILKGNIFK